MANVAIVGAGVAGLAAAWRLRELGHDPVVFEQSGRIGGRVSTVERGPLRFDDGAQFVRADTPLSKELLLRRLPGDRMVGIARDVLPFDRQGAVGAGDPGQNALPKWVYPGGLATLPHLLLERAKPAVHLRCPVRSIARVAGGWRLAGGPAQLFAAVVLTAPAAAAARLLEKSDLGGAGVQMAAAYAAAPYRSIISVAFEPRRPLEAPGDAYALVNSDRKHAVSWLAFEDAKPGYVPEGHQVVIAQMSHGWSAGRLGETDRALANEAAKAVSGLAGGGGGPARWYHVTRWPQALPDAVIQPGAAAAEEGLFLAGDAFTGGRVHLALENGWQAGGAAAAFLSPRASARWLDRPATRLYDGDHAS